MPTGFNWFSKRRRRELLYIYYENRAQGTAD